MIVILIVAIKAVLMGMFCVVLPATLFFVYVKLSGWIIDIALGALGGVSQVTLNASSLAAWVLQTVRFPEALSLYLSLLTLAFVLRLAKR